VVAVRRRDVVGYDTRKWRGMTRRCWLRRADRPLQNGKWDKHPNMVGRCALC
jgi:hypothetical protein